MIKKATLCFMSIALLLTGCVSNNSGDNQSVAPNNNDDVIATNDVKDVLEEKESSISPTVKENHFEGSNDIQGKEIIGETSNERSLEFTSLEDEKLLRYVEDTIYSELIADLNSEEYFIENVNAIYYSDEYLEEVAFNSKENIYFGYTMSDLNKQFQGNRFMFTLGDDNQTIVKEYTYVTDDSYEKVIRNVAIGSGVILICVTVSFATAGVAPAASIIFATSAKTATAYALSSGGVAGIAAGIVEGIQTQNFNEAVKAGAVAASEGFMWGAVSGAIIGGISQGSSLYGAAKQTNFTMNQYAQIQQETGFPLDVIKEFHTMDEYQVFRDANLKSTMVGNKSALIKTDIDLTRIDAKGRSNLERMKQGLAPLDSDGISFELHHVGQKKDGTLAILTQAEHDNPVIHGFLKRTEAHGAGNNWDAERQAFWKAFAAMAS